MTRSLVLPGWGQLYNNSWPKAAAVAAGEGALIVQIVHDTDELNHLQSQIDAARAATDPDAEQVAVDAYNGKLNERTNHSWWLAAVVAYSMLDAYVDAHFRGFHAEFGALPDGSGGLEPRATLRWAF